MPHEVVINAATAGHSRRRLAACPSESSFPSTGSRAESSNYFKIFGVSAKTFLIAASEPVLPEGMIHLDVAMLPKQNRYLAVLRDFVIRRTCLTIKHCKRHVLDVVLFCKLFEFRLIGIWIATK